MRYFTHIDTRLKLHMLTRYKLSHTFGLSCRISPLSTYPKWHMWITDHAMLSRKGRTHHVISCNPDEFPKPATPYVYTAWMTNVRWKASKILFVAYHSWIYKRLGRLLKRTREEQPDWNRWIWGAELARCLKNILTEYLCSAESSG